MVDLPNMTSLNCHVGPPVTWSKTSITILKLETAWCSNWKRWHTGSWNHTIELLKAYLIISLQGEFLIFPSDPVSSNNRRTNGEHKPSSSCCRWCLMIRAKVSCGSTKTTVANLRAFLITVSGFKNIFETLISNEHLTNTKQAGYLFNAEIDRLVGCFIFFGNAGLDVFEHKIHRPRLPRKFQLG